MVSQQRFAQELHKLVNDLPDELVEKLADALAQADATEWPYLRLQVMNSVAHPAVRDRLTAFLDYWQLNAPTMKGTAVALALLSSAAAAEHHRRLQQLELVWTGPDNQVIPLRRTDQALLQLIQDAERSLHIVSFAVYKVEIITKALVAAAERGVAISIYLETPDASEGKMTYDTIRALGRDVAERSQIYVWPKAKRPLSADGKYGSMHAKIGLADGRQLLLSSANLTEYAMTLNMETGILISGGPTPVQMERLLARLVEKRVFVPVK